METPWKHNNLLRIPNVLPVCTFHFSVTLDKSENNTRQMYHVERTIALVTVVFFFILVMTALDV